VKKSVTTQTDRHQAPILQAPLAASSSASS